MTVTGTMPCHFSTKLGNVFDLTMDLDRLIPFKEALLVVAPFVPASFLDEWALLGDTDEEIPVARQTAVLPAARHLRFRGSSSEWSGQSA